MADEAETSQQPLCFKCGTLPVAEGGILCTSCREFLGTQTAREIYAALGH